MGWSGEGASYHIQMIIRKVFTPLSARRGKRPQSFLELEEGVPDYMFPVLRKWLQQTSLFIWQVSAAGGDYYLTPAGEELLLVLKMSASSMPELWQKFWDDRDLVLDALDYVLAASISEPFSVYDVHAHELERILQKGRSAWMVGPKMDELIERLPEETKTALVEATSAGDAPAQHLADAWQNGWSRTPNATSSYHSGIMAIESAMRSIVSPDHPKATLGTMLRAVKDKPSKWQTRFDGDNAAGVVGLEQVLRAVWEAHVRHGEDEYASVTIEQARDVCHVALLVVNLANSRGFERSGG